MKPKVIEVRHTAWQEWPERFYGTTVNIGYGYSKTYVLVRRQNQGPQFGFDKATWGVNQSDLQTGLLEEAERLAECLRFAAQIARRLNAGEEIKEGEVYDG